MISVRTIGVFLIACAAICLTIAAERYYSAVQTATAIAEQIEGVEFESASLPTVSIVCGLVGIVMLVAGVRLLIDALSRKTEKRHAPGLLEK